MVFLAFLVMFLDNNSTFSSSHMCEVFRSLPPFSQPSSVKKVSCHAQVLPSLFLSKSVQLTSIAPISASVFHVRSKVAGYKN